MGYIVERAHGQSLALARVMPALRRDQTGSVADPREGGHADPCKASRPLNLSFGALIIARLRFGVRQEQLGFSDLTLRSTRVLRGFGPHLGKGHDGDERKGESSHVQVPVLGHLLLNAKRVQLSNAVPNAKVRSRPEQHPKSKPDAIDDGHRHQISQRPETATKETSRLKNEKFALKGKREEPDHENARAAAELKVHAFTIVRFNN